jgi:hypothetical protein
MVAIPRFDSTLERIERAVEEEAEDGLRAHLGASIIGRPCDRSLWYSFRWASERRHEGRILRLFERGSREEATMVELLRKAGCTVWDVDPETGQQFRVSAVGGHFGGSLDGVVIGLVESDKPHVLELKTHNKRSFGALQKQGVEKAKPEHYVQMQAYMYLMDIERAYYLAVCKDDDHLYAERVRAKASAATNALSRAERIICSDRPPHKISDDPTWHECKWCDHHALCHLQATPLANCRTCIHATARLDGDRVWHCAKHDKNLTEEEQRAGCDQHLFLPDLLRNWADQVDAGAEGVWYVHKQHGKRFLQGDMGYASKEIEAAKHGSLIAAPETEEIKEAFEGRLV